MTEQQIDGPTKNTSRRFRLKLSSLMLLVTAVSVFIFFAPNLWHSFRYRHVDESVLEANGAKIVGPGSVSFQGVLGDAITDPVELTDALVKFRTREVVFHGYQDFSQLGNIETLEDVCYWHNDVLLDRMNFLANVQQLTFINSRVQTSSSKTFEQVTGVAVVNSQIEGGIEPFLDRCPNLTYLCLSFNSDSEGECIPRLLEKFHDLESLRIMDQPLDLVNLQKFPNLPMLTRMWLGNCEIASVEVDWIIENYPTLKSLTLSDNPVCKEDLKKLVKLPALEELHLEFFLESTDVSSGFLDELRNEYPKLNITCN